MSLKQSDVRGPHTDQKIVKLLQYLSYVLQSTKKVNKNYYLKTVSSLTVDVYTMAGREGHPEVV